MQTLPVEPVRRDSSRQSGSDATLEPEVRRIQAQAVTLGRLLEASLMDSVAVLRRRATVSMEPLVTLDHEISKKRISIETDCLSLIVAGQPVDGAMRTIAATMEVVAELEHIGKYISDIAQTHLMLARVDDSLLPVLNDMELMANRAQSMLHRAMHAFVRRDVALAQAVHEDDDAVDRLYRQICEDVRGFMNDQSRILVKQARYLAQITRNLERAADRVTNICEWIIFAATGRLSHETERIQQEGRA